MKIRWRLVALALAVSAQHAPSDEPSRQLGRTQSSSFVTPRAIEDGAIYEVKLRVRWEGVSEYLEQYARWYLPVDQYVCDHDKYASNCESSGRKLVSLVTREHGDNYNLIFLWRYESSYKENYYCKYSKAFFQYHLAAATPKFAAYFQRVLDERGLKMRLEDAVNAFPAQCAVPPKTEAQEKALQQALYLASETFNKIDLELFTPRIESDEASWNLPVDVCTAAEVKKNPKVTREELEVGDDKNPALCPKFRRSLLRRAVEVEWKK